MTQSLGDSRRRTYEKIEVGGQRKKTKTEMERCYKNIQNYNEKKLNTEVLGEGKLEATPGKGHEIGKM